MEGDFPVVGTLAFLAICRAAGLSLEPSHGGSQLLFPAICHLSVTSMVNRHMYSYIHPHRQSTDAHTLKYISL